VVASTAVDKAMLGRAEDQTELGAGEVFAEGNRCAAQAKDWIEVEERFI
jgi:hypothetical protein